MSTSSHDQNDDSRDGLDDLTSDERRSETDSQRRDRRVIERVSEPELRKYLRLSKQLCNVVVISSMLYVAALIGRHLRDTTLELNRSIFFAVVVAITAFAFHHLSSAIKSYIENESKARLVVVTERLFRMLFIVVITSIVLGVSHLITLF